MRHINKLAICSYNNNNCIVAKKHKIVYYSLNNEQNSLTSRRCSDEKNRQVNCSIDSARPSLFK